ncbi:MAG: S8 family serine peptidase [Planctomycetales bacterium]|nr:S8 family serine peptidase [Planctomycetales bacterium]
MRCLRQFLIVCALAFYNFHLSACQAQNPVLGPAGINSTVTGLTGAFQLLGQVEPGRPGLEFFDTGTNFNSSVSVDPLELFFGARMNVGISAHAESVAGLMVGQNAANGGVATGAFLTSGGYSSPFGPSQVRAAATAQAMLMRGPRRAINMSFGTAPAGGPPPTGTDLLTMFNDWSAAKFDYLPVVAGDETGVVLTVPSDHYNGLSVSMLSQTGGVYRQVAAGNVFTTAANGRRLIDIAAPGVGVRSATLNNRFTVDTFTDSNNNGLWDSGIFDNNGSGTINPPPDMWIERGGGGTYNDTFNPPGDWYFDANHNGVRDGAANDDYAVVFADPRFGGGSEPVQDVDGNGIIDFGVNGTSFAAPLVTGSVALLHEHLENNYGFINDGQHHQVVKAAMMNSADKRKDDGNGLLLGMQKTALRTNGNDWIQQRAVEAGRDAIPLDLEMGTGILNVQRAVTQLDQNQQDPGTIDTRGWDYEPDISLLETIKYDFDENLVANSWISATLAWDRIVPLLDNWDGDPIGADNGLAGVFDAELLIDDDGSGGPSPGDPFADMNGDGVYQAGNHDNFSVANIELPDLDLYLMPKGATSTAQAIAKSDSTLYSVEHIFAQIPAQGDYELWVQHNGGTLLDVDYGLAWWSVGLSQIPEPTSLLLFALGAALLLPRHRTQRP